MCTVTGCYDNTPVSVNVESDTALQGATLGIANLEHIGNALYYDTATGIVYFWNGFWQYSYSTMPTAYYAPNGLPYKYNPETNTFEQIESVE